MKQEIKDEFVQMASEKEYIYAMTDVSESENYLMFKTNIAIFILNKKTQILEAYKTIQNSSTKLSSNSYISIGNNSRMVGSILRPSLLVDIKERVNEYPNFDNFELLKLAKKVKGDDNPILLLYEFK